MEKEFKVNRRLLLSELFEGDQYEAIRQAIVARGSYSTEAGRTLFVKTVPIEGSDDREILSIAAVSRDPGLTQTILDEIQDFQAPTSEQSFTAQADKVKQYWQIYKTEGLVNNAVNKYAALLSGGGAYKIRKVRKGKKQNALEIADALLDHWVRNVNMPGENQVATGSLGLRSLTEQAIRVALVEGNWIGRHVWSQVEVPGFGNFSLPMTIQTMSLEFMEPAAGLGGLGQLWYWRPPAALRRLLTGETKPANPLVGKMLKRLVGSDIVSQLRKDGRALLDSSLLINVRHRGSDREQLGESFLEPAKLGIRYLRSVMATDMVSMENLISAITIVMVGSADPDSPYSKETVAQARVQTMQGLFAETAPNMVIVWQGDDVKIERVGAKDTVSDFKSHHEIGERKVKVALGIPDALLSGSTSDGKSAGWASLLAASGQAEHLGGAFANVWSYVGRLILLENNFTDIEVTYEYDRTLLADQFEARNQNRLDYQSGLLSIRTAIKALNRDPEAEFRQRCVEQGLDPATALWQDVFKVPEGLPGAGENGIPGAGGDPAGRPDDGEAGAPSRAPSERQDPNERR